MTITKRIIRHSAMLLLMASMTSGAQENIEEIEVQDNASSPLAKLNFVDFRYKNYDLSATPNGDLTQKIYSIDGVTMLTENNRLAYKVNYAESDLSAIGMGEHNELSNVELSWAHLFSGGELFGVEYKAGAGFEVNKNFGDFDKGTGFGRDLITPQGGVGWILSPTTQVLTLAQYFHSFNEDDFTNPMTGQRQALDDINMPAARLIVMHMFPQTYSWLFIDNKFVVDLENGNETGNMLEIQVGQMFSPSFGVYAEFYKGTGDARMYDHGIAFGIRFML